MARYDAGNGRYGGDYWDAGYTGGGFAGGGSYYGGGYGGGGYYAGSGDWYGGYDAPRYDRGYRGPGTAPGEETGRVHVGGRPYNRGAARPGLRGFYDSDFAHRYESVRYRAGSRGGGAGYGGRRHGRFDDGGRSGWHP